MIELLVSALVIDISSQRIYAYTNDPKTPAYVASIATGSTNKPTPTGLYYIGSKYENTDLVGKDYRVNLDNVMCLSGPDIQSDIYCIHPTPYPNVPLSEQASRGCVRTSAVTAKWLFDRTTINTPVYIDP